MGDHPALRSIHLHADVVYLTPVAAFISAANTNGSVDLVPFKNLSSV